MTGRPEIDPAKRRHPQRQSLRSFAMNKVLKPLGFWREDAIVGTLLRVEMESDHVVVTLRDEDGIVTAHHCTDVRASEYFPRSLVSVAFGHTRVEGPFPSLDWIWTVDVHAVDDKERFAPAG